jgi:nucleotide-binding universal stress UspA family protein
MLNIKRVLYPTDFSDASKAGLPAAVRIAEIHGARLEVFHAVVWRGAVMPPPTAFSDGFADVEEMLAGIATEKLRDMAEGEPAGVEVAWSKGHAVSAPPAILARARVTDSDLIVMATHGRRGFRRLLLGSVTEEVVRHAPCPVMTVRAPEGEAAEQPSFGNIVVATDFSSGGGLAIDGAIELAAATGAHLEIVHVIEAVSYPGFYYPLNDAKVYDLPLLRRKAAEELQDLLDRRSITGVAEARVRVEVGRPATEIVKFANEVGADLIVVASHGRTGLNRALMGSVAEGVLREAACPVLVLRVDGKSLLPSAERAGREAGVAS